MEQTYLLHTALALWSLIVGAFLCTVYDMFRLFRVYRKHNSVSLFFSDLAFCAIASVTMLLLFFNLSYGRMRAYSFVLVTVGFVLWRLTVGRILFSALKIIIDRVLRLLNSLKMRIRALLKSMMRRIYSFYYCKKTVSSVGKYFPLTKRRELKNGAKDTDPH